MPALLPVWAATGTIEAPDNTKISVGWLLGEKPPHEYMNWWQNLVTQRVNHVLAEGIADHDTTISYAVGALTKVSGIVYKAITANTNSVPPSANWKRITEDAAALSTGVLPNGRLNGAYTGVTSFGVTGAVTAGSFVGAGSGITALNASNLASGTVPDARITGSYTGLVNLTASGVVTAGSFAGNGASLVSMNATQLATGTVNDARLPTTMAGKSFSSAINFGSRVAATTADLSEHINLYGGSYGFNITGSRLGVIAPSTARVNFVFGTTIACQVSADGFMGQGGLLTGLNASQLLTGVVPSARIAGNYNGFVNLTASGTIVGAQVRGQLVHENHAGYFYIGAFSSTYGSGYMRGYWDDTARELNIFADDGGLTTVRSGRFFGDGSLLSGLNGSAITAGTVSALRLDTGSNAVGWVGARFAQVPASGIGMLALATDVPNRSTSYGSTRSGQDLRPGNCEDQGSTSQRLPTGSTWICLGRTIGGADEASRTTIWQRVS